MCEHCSDVAARFSLQHLKTRVKPPKLSAEYSMNFVLVTWIICQVWR